MSYDDDSVEQWSRRSSRRGRRIGDGIIRLSQGLSDAQNKALSPLNSVGTDIIVTRTVAPTLSTATTTTHHSLNGFGVVVAASAAAAAAVVVASRRWYVLAQFLG